ncbi:MAG: ABC transporter permease [Anaerolineales bacterium]|nr:ABC transporter permease [Anaerolineales bacterium]
MKLLDIAIKDMLRSFRSAFAVVFMFVVPLLVSGMFYLMFGNMAEDGGFDLPRTEVVIANLDEGGPKFQVNPKNVPGGKDAETMGELIINIMESDEMNELVEVSYAPDAQRARTAVDNQQAQVAIIIPEDFSDQFADQEGEAFIEFYQDPTLTLGPEIIRAMMNRFMDGMAGVKIAVNVFLDEAALEDQILAGQVVQQYLEISLAETENVEEKLLDVRSPAGIQEDTGEEKKNLLLSIVGPIMGGMMIFYAYFTGAESAQSILKEEEERTLPRLFTTPTTQTTILSGKLLSVFLTVAVQTTTLLIAGTLIFGIQWGRPLPVFLSATGIVLSASSLGIFLNSFLKNTKQAGVLFGGVLTVTGMLGLISVFTMNSPTATKMGDTISLLVPQGWAIRGLMQAMEGEPVSSVLLTTLALLVWSVICFVVGLLRFNKRYE